MKLVDILARELKEWEHEYDHVAQEYDGQLWCGSSDIYCSGNIWLSEDGEYGATLPVAEDWQTAIVTRSEWEAARAKLSKPKGGRDGWIRHRGGKCPVEAGTLVDVKYRGGEIVNRHYATADETTSQIALETIWQHRKDDKDIMYYRIHNPEPEVVKESLSVDPLAWRDRITEIDAESKDEAERHNAVMTALDTERAELVRKLANEGLALIGDNH